MALDLTIAIPAKNEELNLPGCLEAIGTGFAMRPRLATLLQAKQKAESPPSQG